MENADQMEVRARSGELLVLARRDGCGGMHCAQKESGAKHSLAVLQHEKNPCEAEFSKPCAPVQDAPDSAPQS